MHALIESICTAKDLAPHQAMDSLWGFRESGVGFVVAEAGRKTMVASVPVSGLPLTGALVDQVRTTNTHLPLGAVYLSKGDSAYSCCWCFTMQTSWLDDGGDGVVQMLLDVLGNAAGLTQRIAGELSEFGGNPVDPRNDYFPVLIAGIAL